MITVTIDPAVLERLDDWARGRGISRAAAIAVAVAVFGPLGLNSLVLVVVGYVAFGAPLRLLALGILSAAPDFDVLVGTLRHGQGEYWWPGHRSSFPHGRAAPLPGIATQAVVVIAAAAALALH